MGRIKQARIMLKLRKQMKKGDYSGYQKYVLDELEDEQLYELLEKANDPDFPVEAIPYQMKITDLILAEIENRGMTLEGQT